MVPTRMVGMFPGPVFDDDSLRSIFKITFAIIKGPNNSRIASADVGMAQSLIKSISTSSVGS